MSSAHDGRRCRWDEGGKRWGKRQSFLETRASTRLCLRANTRLGEAGPVARILNLKRTLVSSGSEETCGIGRGDTHSFHFDAVILPSPNGICSVPHIPRSLPCHLQCRLPVLQIHGSHASTALGWVQLLGGGHLPISLGFLATHLAIKLSIMLKTKYRYFSPGEDCAVADLPLIVQIVSLVIIQLALCAC